MKPVTFLFFALALLLSRAASERGRYADVLTRREFRELRKKAVRREVRDLSDVQWGRITTAMNVMKDTPTEKGKAIYGDDYRSYDWFVCLHVRTVTTRLGDQGHHGPFFFTWHGAFIRKFEIVLQLIDLRIKALPYMDWRRDIEAGIEPADSLLFSEKYFGSLMSSREEGFAVVDGKFPYWQVNNKFTSEETCVSSEWDVTIHNPYGYLRKRTNQNNSPFVTRMGDLICGVQKPCAVVDDAVDCQRNARNISELRECMEWVVHTSFHQCVGGSASVFEGQELTSGCRGHINGAIMDPQTGFNQHVHEVHFNCFSCPDFCALDTDPTECVCVSTGETCQIGSLGTWNYPTGSDSSLFYFAGDMSEPVASPNDPVFMFVHAAVDKYLHEWRVMNWEGRPYYGYPAENEYHGLDAYQYPKKDWMGMFAYLDGFEGPYTYRHILEATDLLASPYVYDSVLAMLRRK